MPAIKLPLCAYYDNQQDEGLLAGGCPEPARWWFATTRDGRTRTQVLCTYHRDERHKWWFDDRATWAYGPLRPAAKDGP